MKTGKLISFKVLANNDKLHMNKFCRDFYGFMDKSNNGKYSYKRKGFINQFKYVKLMKSLLIVKKEDFKEIISFLKKYNASLTMRDVVLSKSDIKTLKL